MTPGRIRNGGADFSADPARSRPMAGLIRETCAKWFSVQVDHKSILMCYCFKRCIYVKIHSAYEKGSVFPYKTKRLIQKLNKFQVLQVNVRTVWNEN